MIVRHNIKRTSQSGGEGRGGEGGRGLFYIPAQLSLNCCLAFLSGSSKS